MEIAQILIPDYKQKYPYRLLADTWHFEYDSQGGWYFDESSGYSQGFVFYHNGNTGFDSPERIPEHIRKLIRQRNPYLHTLI